MGTEVVEWYGFRPSDVSDEARLAALNQECPFIGGDCKKKKSGGVCSVRPSELAQPVVICPQRLYGNGYHFLRQIARDAFSSLAPDSDADGLPSLVPGSQATALAASTGITQIGVFGQGWDQEVKLPPSTDGGASYSVDFTIIAVSPQGELLGFAPVEVQTIDITGSNKVSVDALLIDRRSVPSQSGLNWENVSKRILPQLIVKGLMLQGERLCSHGIYFVTPEAVFNKIARRLGGVNRLREIPKQPGSITFIRVDFDNDHSITPALFTNASTTISTSDMSIAFISPQNLPPAGAYEQRIITKMAPSKNHHRHALVETAHPNLFD